MEAPNVDFGPLLRSTSNAFSLLEQWNQASCDNAAIEPFIRGIQLHGRIYYRALDLSIQVSEDGYKICQDWVDLVEFWNDPNTEREDICEFVADMKDYASQAHAAALAMLEDFRLVRTGLNRMTGDLNTTMDDVKEQEQHAANQKAIYQQRAKRAGRFTDIAMYSNIGVSGGIATALASGVALPAAVFALPVVLPIAGILGFATEVFCWRKEDKREEERVSHEAVLKRLRRAYDHLGEVVSSVDILAYWWGETETKLKTLEINVRNLVPNQRMNTIKQKGLMKGWSDARDRYLGYKNAMYKLQDYYPTSRIR